jgi:MFS family permease
MYPRFRNAALGTAVVFTASGAMLGDWVSRLPAVQERLHATPGQLGAALFAMGIGSLLAMPTSGVLCRKFGTRTMVAVCSALACVALALLGQADSLIRLGITLFCFGVAYGSWDVSMNVQGSAAETAAGKHWMPRYHACWSLGSIGGAALGALAAEQHLPVGPHLLIGAVVSALMVAAGLPFFIDERAGQPVGEHSAHRRRGGVLSRRLILIGLVVLASTIIEGAASDWMAIYLADDRHVSHAAAALAFTAFAIAMTAGRFAGTPVTAWLGRARAVRVGGFLAVAGILVTVLSPVLLVSYAGALFWAAGICLVFPAGVSAAGESARPAESIAVVSTIGYGSILIGPPVIGTLADHIGLQRALLLLVGLGAVIAIFAPILRSSGERVDGAVDAHVGDRVPSAEGLREQPHA